MSKITPIKVEYKMQIKEHIMRVSAEHLELARRITFYFDDKVVSEKAVPPGDFLTDDDCISQLVDNYCKNKTGVYADLFRWHSDKVHLISKTLEFEIENYGIKMTAIVTVKKDTYHIDIDGNGDDHFSGTFKSDSFSDVLEKVRLFTSILTGISNDFSSNINEFSNDKVEAWIKWD